MTVQPRLLTVVERRFGLVSARLDVPEGPRAATADQCAALLDRRETRRADPQGCGDAPGTESEPLGAQHQGGEILSDLAT